MDLPVAGTGAVPGFDPKALRRVLGCFATGVCVLTARDPDGRPVGMTVNSFSSLSLDPPLVLWSIARHSALHAAFTAASHWAINILGVAQAPLAQQFAQRGADRFGGLEFDAGLAALPLLRGCIAHLQCHRFGATDLGDHTLMIGRILALEGSTAEPLVFHAGQFLRCSAAAPLAARASSPQ